MRKIVILLLYALSLWARYEVFVDKNLIVGPGMVYKHLRVFDKLWNINILEIDLTNPYVKIETVKANDLNEGVETLSSMAKRRSFERHQVIAAINGDFFSIDGIPNNVQVVQGQILQNPIKVSALGFDAKNRPWLGMVTFEGEIITANGKHAINRVNGARDFNEMVLYNSYFGTSTQTDRWGTEVAIHPITPWIVNDTVWAVVEAKECFKGNMLIPKDGAVLSAQGDAMNFLNNNAVIGDTIALVLRLSPALTGLMEMIGGFPKIVYQGKNWAKQGFLEEGGPVHAFQIHPRTAIGFNADSTKLYFFTVDGRKPGIYRGMTLSELADVMIDFGVAYGVNLDGGGSTTFLLRGEVVNFPTEGYERPVAAAILAISTSPVVYSEHIQIEPDTLAVYYPQKIKISVKGWDQNFTPLSFKNHDIVFTVSDNLGHVTSDGWFWPTVNQGSGWLYAHYKKAVDSTFVQIIGLQQIDLQPEFMVTDTLQPIMLTVSGLAKDGKKIYLPDSLLKMTLSNPMVGYVENNEFWGLNEGETQIIATLDSLGDTITVQVKGGLMAEILDWMENPEDWQLAGQYVDLQHSTLKRDSLNKRAGGYSLRLDYQFVYFDSNKADYFLKKKIDIYGEPEKIGLDFKSDGSNHHLGFVVSNAEGELFKTGMSDYLNDSTQFVTVMQPIKNLIALDSSAQFHFPIKLEYIWFKPGNLADEGEVVNGSVYFDYLRVQYPKVKSLMPLENLKLPLKVRLLPNYPNPFNSITNIRLDLPNSAFVDLRVFDVRGRLVDVLLRRQLPLGEHHVKWQANNFPSGIYFCKLTVGNTTQVQKMILIK